MCHKDENKIIPLNLKHKPVYYIENYSKIDGKCTDVEGMSIGSAQWNDKIFIPSIKIWRHTGKKWSRQSEETTLTRAIDMSIFILKIIKLLNGNKENSINIAEEVFQIKENPDKNKVEQLKKYMLNKENYKVLYKHIKELKKIINEMQCN